MGEIFILGVDDQESRLDFRRDNPDNTRNDSPQNGSEGEEKKED